MHGLADRRLNCVRRLRGAQVDRYAAWMILLQVRQVDSTTQCGAQIGVPDVTHNADDGGIVFDVISPTFCNRTARSILRRAEETIGEGQVHYGDIGLALSRPKL